MIMYLVDKDTEPRDCGIYKYNLKIYTYLQKIESAAINVITRIDI